MRQFLKRLVNLVTNALMKALIFIISFLSIISDIHGQCQFFLLNFEDTTCMNRFSIDSNSNSSPVWQIAVPQKTSLNTSISPPNVIITDSVNSYPTNDTSRFIITKTAGLGFIFPPTSAGNHTVTLSGYYFVNSDSLQDYGIIEFSPDNGNTWIDIIKDTIYLNDPDWDPKRPILTGNSNGWQYFRVDLYNYSPGFSIQQGDTILYRFSFVSDSTFDNLDGLMFDDLHFDDFAESTNNLKYKMFKSKCYPNPAGEKLNVDFKNLNQSEFSLTIYDQFGKKVFFKNNIREGKVNLNISLFQQGLYFYRLIDSKKTQLSIGKFTKTTRVK